MMNIFIILFIFIHLAMHQYLSNADRAGLFPEHMGFLAFVLLSNIFYVGNFIYIFGAIWGSLIFLSSLCFSLPYACVAWPFQIIIMKTVNSISGVRAVLAIWAGLTWVLLILFILNFFISEYAAWKMPLQENIAFITVICVIGFILRLAIVKIAQSSQQN